MSLNHLLDDIFKKYLNIRVNSIKIDGGIIIPTLLPNYPVETNSIGQLISKFIDVSNQVEGTLKIENGGTNSNTALSNGFIMESVDGKIVENNSASDPTFDNIYCSNLNAGGTVLCTNLGSPSNFVTNAYITNAIISTQIDIKEPIINLGVGNGSVGDSVNEGFNVEYKFSGNTAWSSILRSPTDNTFYFTADSTVQPGPSTDLTLLTRSNIAVGAINASSITVNGDLISTNGELIVKNNIASQEGNLILTLGTIELKDFAPSRLLAVNSMNLLADTDLITWIQGTVNRLLVTDDTTGGVVLNISPSYIGQSSITTLGTIISGTWNASVVGPLYGGTGVANSSSITLNGGNFVLSGGNNTTLTTTGSTNVTLPTSGTLLTSSGAVTNISGTTDRITTSASVGSVVLNIAPTYIGQNSITTLGTVSSGTWNADIIGSLYGGTGVSNSSIITLNGGNFTLSGGNNTTLTTTGLTNVTLPTSGTLLTSSSAVTNISGTTNRITASASVGSVTIDIASNYIGQTTITTLGTVSSGTWHGTILAGQFGGTNTSNIGKTITVGGNFTTSGSNNVTLTSTGVTNVTLPTTGTLSTLDGIETLTNKTLTSPIISTIINSGTITLFTSTDTVVGRNTTDTLTNKTLTSPIIDISSITNGAGTFNFNSAGSVTVPSVGGSDIVMTLAAQQDVPFKNFSDASCFWIKSGDSSKKLGFTLTNQTTNKTLLIGSSVTGSNTYNIPEVGAAADFTMTEGTQTINGNKTLSGTINLSGLSVSSLVATDGSKNLTSTVSGLSPTFTGLNLSGLSVSSLVATDGSKNFTSTTSTLSPSFIAVNLTAKSVINASSGSIQAPTTNNTYFQIAGSDNASPTILIDTFGGGAGHIIGRTSAGTPGAKSAVQSGFTLFQIGTQGYGTSQYSTADRAYTATFASENWTNTANGTYTMFATTPTGGTATAERLRLDQNGNLYPSPDNSNSLGTAGNRWTTVYATTGTINTSDEREKKEIIDLGIGLNFINLLKPRQYKFNNGARLHYGLLAQEVKASLDQLHLDFGGYIDGNIATEPKDIYGLRYDEFIAPIIKSIQTISSRLSVVENALNIITSP